MYKALTLLTNPGLSASQLDHVEKIQSLKGQDLRNSLIHTMSLYTSSLPSLSKLGPRHSKVRKVRLQSLNDSALTETALKVVYQKNHFELARGVLNGRGLSPEVLEKASLIKMRQAKPSAIRNTLIARLSTRFDLPARLLQRLGNKWLLDASQHLRNGSRF